MTGALRHARHQAGRVLFGPRWAAFTIAAVLVAVLAAGEVEAEVSNSGLRASALDVHAATTNNLMFVGYLLLTSLAFVAGDRVAADLETGFVRHVVLRRLPVPAWWCAHLSAVACAACAGSAMVLAVTVGVGALKGMPLGGTPSALAIAPALQHGAGLFPPIAAGVDMWARQIAVAGYVAFGWFALLATAVSVTCWFPKRTLPVTLVLLGLMADLVAVKASEHWRPASLGLRLLEGAHGRAVADALDVRVSVGLYAGLLVAAFALGLAGLRRRDL